MQIRNNEKTEWFHCSIDLLEEAFEKIKKKFGGSPPRLMSSTSVPLNMYESDKTIQMPYDKPVREYE
jgi:hypothetical protein